MVSGTGERTIASWAALAVVAGLALSAAPAAHAAPTTSPDESAVDEAATQTTVENLEDDDTGAPTSGDETDTGSPTPSPTTTPSLTPEPEPTDPTGPTSPNAPDTSGQEDQPEPEFSCPEGGGVDPGEPRTVECTVPDEFTIDLGATETEHGIVTRDGHRITFTADSAVYGTQTVSVAVIGTGPDGEETSVPVQFTVYGNDDSSPTPTPTPTEEQDPEPTPSESETPTPPESPDPTDPGTSASESESPVEDEDPVESDPAGPTTSTPASPLPTPPGAPGNSSIEPPPKVFPPLPIPGMPRPENAGPDPSAGAGEQPPERNEEENSGSDDDDGLLAQTGPEQVAWAGSLAATSIFLGVAALASARRQTRRRSGS